MSEGFTPLTPAAVGGKRRSHKKLRMVKKKTVRKMLSKMGLKMRGGAASAPAAEVKPESLASTGTGVVATDATPTSTGGRRRRHTKKTHRRGRSLFGMKY